ncbi:MAG: riboflavin synthase [Reyranellaceae bacterium]
MFTGIITDIGRIAERVDRGASGDRLFVIETRYDMASVDLGASIACSGCCLTVTEKGRDGRAQGDWFAVEASQETLSRTTLGDWQAGTRVNLERSLRLGDELGGHLVYGHVDGVGRITARRPEGGSLRFTVEAPEALARYVASKGSVAIDGVSLTVNEVSGGGFGVNIIAHTQQETTFGGLQPGQRVNLEVDMLARYVARLLGRDTL